MIINYLLLLTAYLFYAQSQSQMDPFYDNSQTFYVGYQQVYFESYGIQDYIITFPTGFTISEDTIRQPFFGIQKAYQNNIMNWEQFIFRSRIADYSAIDMTFQLQNIQLGQGGSYGFASNSYIDFRYLVIRDIFPQIYFSMQLYLDTSFTIDPPYAYKESFTMSWWADPVPFLLGNDTVFLYTYTDCWMYLTTGNQDAAFGVRLNFTVIDQDWFSVNIINKYNTQFYDAGINVFIYNKNQFEQLKIQLEHQYFTFVEPYSDQIQFFETFSVKFLTDIDTFFLGFSGFQIYDQNTFSFSLSIDSETNRNDDYLLYLYIPYSGMFPKLQFLAFLVSQLTCPVDYYFINEALDMCYDTSCPPQTFLSTLQFGFTGGISICLNCIATCLQCMTTPDFCTFCDPAQFRTMFGSDCIPISHYYDDGVNAIAMECDPTCMQCKGISTYCISCFSDSFLDQNNQCILCSDEYGVECLSCNFNSCTSCDVGFTLSISGSCIVCADYHSECNSCNESSCTGCNLGFYLFGAVCQPCSNYHSQCIQCDNTTCTMCMSPYFATPVGSCVNCTDYHTQCDTCDNYQCLTCNLGFYLNAFTCLPCSNFNASCLQCSSTQCTLCDSANGYTLTTGGSCILCTDYSTQCSTCDGSSCLTCNLGFYLNGYSCLPCSNFHSQCLQCTSTQCTLCDSALGFQTSVTGSCLTCAQYSVQCATCSSSSCLTCSLGFYQLGTSCASCQNFHTQCTQCSSTACTSCGAGFQVSTTGSCVSCSDYHSHCTNCDGTTCTACSPLYAVKGISCISCVSYHFECNTCDANFCTQCNSGYFVALGSCSLCSAKYGTECSSCDSSQCFTCQNGYFVDPATLICTQTGCGDGIWINAVEACDDGNLDNGDGCDSQCNIEPDYACLLADKLPSGASLCKYTKSITVVFNYLQKTPSANTLNLYFNLTPSTLKSWNEQTIQDLLTPVQIVDQKTGLANIIPYESMIFNFNKNSIGNQIQITITYNQSSLQNSYLRFNIDPVQTNIPELASLATKTDLYAKISSGRSGVGLYNYPAQIYQYQKSIQSFAFLLAMLFFVMLILGFVMPYGKLIILEGLSVVQISYFSILQFEKITPSFISFKKLIISNGYNDPSFFPSLDTFSQLRIFELMGLDRSMISNYNISFALFFLFPTIVGTLGIIISKIIGGKQKQEDLQSANVLTNEKDPQSNVKNFGQLFMKRYLFQTSFYGLVACGYLIWVSALLTLEQIETINFIYLAIVSAIWITYMILFLNLQFKFIDLRQCLPKQSAKPQKKSSLTTFTTNFGEFKSILSFSQTQNIKNKPKLFKLLQNFYLVYMVERLVISAVIVVLPSIMSYVSLVIILIQSALLIGLVMLHSKVSEKKKETQGMFSYLHKNYALRQFINLITIIVIQLIYLLLSVLYASSGPEQTLSKNMFVIKGFPMAILVILLCSFVFNLFLWIWELKSQRFLVKSRIALSVLFPSLVSAKIKEDKDFEQESNQISNLLNKNPHQANAGQASRMNITQNQQEQMSSLMSSYLNNSAMFKNKKSPFIGIAQKQGIKKNLNHSILDMLQSEAVSEKSEQYKNEQGQQSNVLQNVWDEI